MYVSTTRSSSHPCNRGGMRGWITVANHAPLFPVVIVIGIVVGPPLRRTPPPPTETTPRVRGPC